MTFVGGAFSEDKLLAAGYAFEQATNVRHAPSFTNPSMWRCVTGSTFFSPHHCHPGDLQSDSAAGPTEFPVAAGVGGTVPATLSLSLGTPAAFGAFAPGVSSTYTASTTATVTSTAGSALLSVADPSSTSHGPARQRHVRPAAAAAGRRDEPGLNVGRVRGRRRQQQPDPALG